MDTRNRILTVSGGILRPPARRQRASEAVKQSPHKKAHGSASQEPDWPPINTDEHRLRRIGLSVFIGVYRWPGMFFSGSLIGGKPA